MPRRRLICRGSSTNYSSWPKTKVEKVHTIFTKCWWPRTCCVWTWYFHRPEEVIKKWSQPCNITELGFFIGFCIYYRKFVPKSVVLAKPLHALTEKGTKFIWSSDCQELFKTLRNRFISEPILAHPDFTEPFILDTDERHGYGRCVVTNTWWGRKSDLLC